MATWNYDETSSLIVTVDLGADGNIVDTESASSPVKTKNFTVKGFVTPDDEASETGEYGLLGTALSNIFSVDFTLIKARIDANLEV